MDELFAPPAETWKSLSPKYLALKLVLITFWWPVLTAFVALPLWFWSSEQSCWIALAVGAVILTWRLLRAQRAYRRWGYAETDSDIYLTRGLTWRKLTCVPYGRMQLVNVESGPLERAFGLSSIELVTSSVSGTIKIPGLITADAAELRDRLIERGETLQAGI